jgi:CheY-like chemotaxis protein
MTILIVEDNAEMRRYLSGLLRRLTTAIFESSNGREGVAAYELHQPDWVVMDIEMPELDVLAATRAITERHPDAKVLIVSNYSDPNVRAAASAAGACGFVPKERLHELRALLR